MPKQKKSGTRIAVLTVLVLCVFVGNSDCGGTTSATGATTSPAGDGGAEVDDTTDSSTPTIGKRCTLQESGFCGSAENCCAPLVGWRVYVDGGPCDGGDVPLLCSEPSATGGCGGATAIDCVVRESDAGTEFYNTPILVSDFGPSLRRCTSDEKAAVDQAKAACR